MEGAGAEDSAAPSLRGKPTWCAASRHLWWAQPLRHGLGLSRYKTMKFHSLRGSSSSTLNKEWRTKNCIPVLTQVSFVRTDRMQWETWTPNVSIKPQGPGGLHKPSGSEQQITIQKCRWAHAVVEILASFLSFILCAHPMKVTLTENFWQLKNECNYSAM